jgi:hypothetical protein
MPRSIAQARKSLGYLIARKSQASEPSYFGLSCLRLLGVFGERKPSFGHFDEKGLMLRNAGCLRQPNALSSVVA